MIQYLASITEDCETEIKITTSLTADESVTGRMLIYIAYRDSSGKKKELRIKRQISPKWQDLARCLSFSNADVENIEDSNSHKSERCTDKMLSTWISRDVDHTWRKLILKMREVDLGSAAAVLTEALKNRED